MSVGTGVYVSESHVCVRLAGVMSALCVVCGAKCRQKGQTQGVLGCVFDPGMRVCVCVCA